MSDMKYLCPECRSALAAVTEDGFDTWQCKDGHGIGVTLSETYGRLQEDEIQAIWTAAKSAPRSSLKSPALGHPMVAITVIVDEDEIPGNEGTGARPVTLDVAVDEQFLWFEVVDLEHMPADLPNPRPSADELARLQQLAEQSRASIQKDLDAREDVLSSIGYRFGSRAAALLGLNSLMARLGGSAKARLEKK